MTNSLNNLGRAHLAIENVTEAEECLIRALDLAHQIGYAEMVAYALYGLAEIGAKLGRASQAALLIGWADARLSELGVSLQPLEAEARAETLGALEDRLGGDRAATLRGEGAGLAADDAVAIALGHPRRKVLTGR
jgi:tetratricopeptide (TPR) repeat protein